MAIFTKYGNKIIPNAYWEWPLRIEFLQWVSQPHSGRNSIYKHIYFSVASYIPIPA